MFLNMYAIAQVIPAENIIAAFQSSQKTVLAISNNSSEAQIFLEVYNETKVTVYNSTLLLSQL